MAPPRKRLRLTVVGTVVLIAVVLLLVGCGLFGRRRSSQLNWVFRPVAKCEFIDIEDDPEEDVIRELADLGVFEYGEGYFTPDSPVLRGEFIIWLLRANNIFWRDTPSKWIKLASLDEPKRYMDVPPHEHSFPYVNGMLNAGCPLGFETRELHYQRDMSRERLIFVRNGLCLGADVVLPDPVLVDEYRVRLRSFLEDADSVTEEYVPAVLADLLEGNTTKLAFGDTDRLCPKKTVTRREAALALSEVRGRTYKQATDEVLPKWVPLPEAERKRLEEEEAARREQIRGHSHQH